MFITLRRKEEPRLKKWVEAYMGERGGRYHRSINTSEYWLVVFVDLCKNTEIGDLTEKSVKDFMDYVSLHYKHSYWQKKIAFRAIVSFFRFWRGRGHKYLPSITGADFDKFDSWQSGKDH